MPHEARHIGQLLGSTDATSALLVQIRAQDALLARIRRLLPAAIRCGCVQASIRDQQLVISVESPAWAGRLQLSAPTLVAALRQQGTEVEHCRVRVIPPAGDTAPASGRRRLRASPSAAANVRNAAAGIQNAELRQSLARLAAHLSDAASMDSLSGDSQSGDSPSGG